MGTVTVTPANGYSRRGMSGYRAVGAAAAPAWTPAAIAALFTANGWAGDFWDTHDQSSMGGVTDGQKIQSIAGYRDSISLSTAAVSGEIRTPNWVRTAGSLQFPNDGVEHLLDPQSTLGQLQDAYFIAAKGKWVSGFLRLVCVMTATNDVLFDIRVGAAGASNPGGVSALVQNAQANIANIAGITVPAVNTDFCVWMNRTASGNATLGIVINGVTTTGTVTKGASTGTAEATIRYAENFAATGYDFYLDRSVFVKGASLTQDQIDTMVGYVMDTYTPATIPTGKAVFGAKGANIVLSNNDLTATAGIAAWQSAGLSASAITTGKRSVVFHIGVGAEKLVGIGNPSFNTGSYAGSDANSIGFHSDGTKFVNGVQSAFGSAFLPGYKVKMEIDADADTLNLYQWVNGAWLQQGTTVDISALGASVFPVVAVYGTSALTINTGQADYEVNTGYSVGWNA